MLILKLSLENFKEKWPTLAISNQGVSSSKNVEKREIGGIFQGVILEIRNDSTTT
jgi:hypothetical protein